MIDMYMVPVIPAFSANLEQFLCYTCSLTISLGGGLVQYE